MNAGMENSGTPAGEERREVGRRRRDRHVKGDLHDIGKNLVGMMLKGSRLQGRRRRD